MDRRRIWREDDDGIGGVCTDRLVVDIRRRRRSDDDGGGLGGRSDFHDERSVGTVCGGNEGPARQRISRMVVNGWKWRDTDR